MSLISVKICGGKAILFLWVEIKLIYACNAKRYDILKVKDAFVISMYYVTDYSICTLVIA
jgi:hypothetical protein